MYTYLTTAYLNICALNPADFNEVKHFGFFEFAQAIEHLFNIFIMR